MCRTWICGFPNWTDYHSGHDIMKLNPCLPDLTHNCFYFPLYLFWHHLNLHCPHPFPSSSCLPLPIGIICRNIARNAEWGWIFHAKSKRFESWILCFLKIASRSWSHAISQGEHKTFVCFWSLMHSVLVRSICFVSVPVIPVNFEDLCHPPKIRPGP